MPSKDKRKKIQKRLSKLKKLERKEKNKKRTKTKGSKSSNLYQEYVYQKKNRTKTYLLVLFIVLLLCAVGAIVYFTIIKPKLDKNKKPKCNKNEDEDCQINEYLNKEKCECLPCENPNPTCKTDEYYDPNNLPYCRNSSEYITDKDGNKKKMYSCQPCPTCPDGKKVNQCGGGEYDINNKDISGACYRPTPDNNIGRKKVLSNGAIAAIVAGIIIVLGLGVFIFKKYKTQESEWAKGVTADLQASDLQESGLQAAMEAQRAEEERLANEAKNTVAKAKRIEVQRAKLQRLLMGNFSRDLSELIAKQNIEKQQREKKRRERRAKAPAEKQAKK